MLKRNVQEMKFLFVKIWPADIKIFKGFESLQPGLKGNYTISIQDFSSLFHIAYFFGRIDNSSKINLMSKLSYCGSEFCF